MKRPMYCLGVGTTCPEGGSNSDPYTFFRPYQYIGQERDILRPQVLQSCQGFRLQSAFGQLYLKQSTKTKATWIRSSRYSRARRMLIQV